MRDYKDFIILIIANIITLGVVLFLGWISFQTFGLFGLVVPLSMSGLAILFMIRIFTQQYESYTPPNEKKEERTLHERLSSLEERVNRLESIQPSKKPVLRKGDMIYSIYKDELERDHMDEIVAIDMRNKKPIAFGKTVSEAYRNAKIQEPSQDQFYFRRIGKAYLEKM